MEWQPIETAPKAGPYDGGTIMLWGPGMGVGIGWWNDCSEYGKESYWVNDCFPDHSDDCDPTHWMPLPEPPEIEGSEQRSIPEGFGVGFVISRDELVMKRPPDR